MATKKKKNAFNLVVRTKCPNKMENKKRKAGQAAMYNHGQAGSGWTPDDFDLLRQVVASMPSAMKDKAQYSQGKWCADECRLRHPSFNRTGYAISHKLKSVFQEVMGREFSELKLELNQAQADVLLAQAERMQALQQLEQEKAAIEARMQDARAAVEKGASEVRREFMAKI